MSYNVKLGIFEGPFDLLVYLIEKSKMNIYDINVAEITGQYIEYMDRMSKLDIELSSDFLVLAATLIYIKSKMLLPGKAKDEDSDDDTEDPRTELVEKLLEYKKFKSAAAYLMEQEEIGRCIYVKPQEDLTQYTDAGDKYIDLNVNEFVNVFSRFLLRKKKIEDVRKRYTEVRRRKISVEDKMAALLHTLSAEDELSFEDLIGSNDDTYEIVLTFLGILELLKQHAISAVQSKNFGEIVLKYNGGICDEYSEDS